MKKNTLKVLSLLIFLFANSIHSQSEKEKKVILKYSNVAKLNQLKVQYGESQNKIYEKAVDFANLNGFPVSMLNADGSYSEVKEVTTDGILLYRVTSNDGSAFTSRTNRLGLNGGLGLNLTGEGLYVGVWDQDNANVKHEDFGGRAFVYDNNTNPISNHSTHVTGTMISSGLNSIDGKGRGIAHKAYAYVSNWTRDLEEMAQLALNNGLLVSNHSYGLQSSDASFPVYIFGAYRNDSRDLDAVAFSAPYYQPVIAAGNDRNNIPTINPTKNGYDLLSDFSTSKNAIVVAAVNGLDANGYVDPNGVVMSAFSSWGPTDDNRVKPDISTKGVNVYSTSSAAGNKGYATLSGTSMAAPAVTATLLLLQEHFRNTTADFMRSATLRGLVIHTADEAGDADGPDPRFGWGLINAEKSVEVITDAYKTTASKKAIVQEFDTRTISMTQGSVFTKTVKAKGSVPLKATISWTDRSGNSNMSTVDLSTPVLVNDLDIRIEKGEEIFYPWRLNDVKELPAIKADNFVDNVEKIEIANPLAEVYTIKITHKGRLVGENQDFSLIISGLDDSSLANNDFEFTSISVWPNPMTDIVNIAVHSELSEAMYLEVYDILGIRHINKKISQPTNDAIQSLDVKYLQPGLYVFKIIQGKKESIWKVLKK
jgi:serine protease AprX